MLERRFGEIVPVLLFCSLLWVVGPVPRAVAGDGCGHPLTPGPDPQTSDCLYVVQSAVGIHDCELCVCDVNGDGTNSVIDGLRCLKAAVGHAVDLLCPPCSGTTTTTVTSTTLAAGRCPEAVEWTTRAGYGPRCSENADCAAGDCDHESGRCRTESRFDIGWVGAGHHSDWNDGFTTSLRLDCQNEGPPCGHCAVTGVDPSHGNCRCSNDTRTICTEPFAEAAAECSGLGRCDCYDGAPVPMAAGGTPACLVPLLREDVSGHVQAEHGDVELHKSLRLRGHYGLGTRSPCPTCGGTCSDDPSEFCNRDEDCTAGTCSLDPVANDGVRGGVCSDYPGSDSGKPCDIQAFHSSFPANPDGSSGGAYSLDCMPNNNFTGQGLRLDFAETTGASELASRVPCHPLLPELDCACLVCSSDGTVACDSDEDCAMQPGSCSKSSTTSCDSDGQCLGVDVGPCQRTIGRCSKARTAEFVCTTDADCLNRDVGTCAPSTCVSKGIGDFPLPNQCADQLCSDLGNGTGECTTGPDDKFCSGVVDAGGRGVLRCSREEDCVPTGVILESPVPCDILQRRSCFPDPIEAEGRADPNRPVTVATFCMPPTTNAGMNHVLGLPGPARLVRQSTLRLRPRGDR